MNTATIMGQNILCIETSLANGSLALMTANGVLVRSGTEQKDRSVVSRISSILNDAHISVSKVETIGVSIGPGSFTGIRIGISTGIGLARSGHSSCIGIETLTAVASVYREIDRIAVVPMGRGMFAMQYFEAGSVSPPSDRNARVVSQDELADFAAGSSSDRFVLASEVPELLFENDSSNIARLERPAAEMMCGLVAEGFGTHDLIPKYLKREGKSPVGL